MKIQYRAQSQAGFTLVELMVAMTIGLLVSAAALQLFIGGAITARLQEANAQLQDSGVFGIGYIAQDIRLANYGNVSNPELNDTATWGGIVLTGDATSGNLPFASVNSSWLSHSEGDNGWSGLSNVDAGASDQLTIQFIAPNDMTNCEGENVSAGDYIIQRYFLRKDMTTGAAATDYVLACDANKKPTATGNPGVLSDIKEFGGASLGEAIIPRVDYVRFYLGTRIGNKFAYYTINQYRDAATAARAATPAKAVPRILSVKIVTLVRSRDKINSKDIDAATQSFDFPDIEGVKANDTTSKYIRRMYSTTIAIRNAMGEKI
ncbi:PilW family protein [Acinetobacter radioresistens]|jgi:type IV pilus assembly protein PilW|uniref:PilW family protein n=1 Tax=Acinetobacter TaxID=469 RepID=UPI0002CF0635|nr:MULTISPECIES: PilW family protein [Acinetobacter]ENV85677.1 hypothetical protein F940_01904 [Acinetobacter radioresistens NIPH 2130]EXB87805.1 prepilin-type N-terminal cleavage/methylation domain protein [Acinetobacter sp. 272263]MCK4077659.1 prepilin-type N-terminal cleavage/methylation domain-containing protein [Acinetobacter radioresistens]MCK4084295.1 prepilin-type N-terminal cleavage/methylation domain-containing protein [Acinetobacter radioresistens]MCK4098180.1 prepilin-type N-termin